MKLHHISRRGFQRAYTLVEALVASAVLMVGIGAAASLSLSLVTQEEINERSARAYNYLENATTLYYLGVDTDDIEDLLPKDPAVKSLKFTPWNPVVSAIKSTALDGERIRLEFYPNGATKSNSSKKEEWTGGEKDVSREVEVYVYRSEKAYETAN